MNNLIKRQACLQKSIAIAHKNNSPVLSETPAIREVVSEIKDMAYFLQLEIHELLLEIGNNDSAVIKPWKSLHKAINQENFVSTDRIKQEAIDILCFCLNICIIAGLDEHNFEEYFEKVFRKNLRRLEEGY